MGSILDSFLPSSVHGEAVSVSVLADLSTYSDSLADGERDRANHYTQERRAEFILGRSVLHKAIDAVEDSSHTPQALLPDANGYPDSEVPSAESLSYSLSHLRTRCEPMEIRVLAVASTDPALHGIGIDCEFLTELSEQIIDIVCTQYERGRLETYAAELGMNPGECALLMFSLKEAAYKAMYPTVRRFIDFHEIEVVPTAEGRAIFTVKDANLRTALGTHVQNLTGRWMRDDSEGIVTTYAQLGASASGV